MCKSGLQLEGEKPILGEWTSINVSQCVRFSRQGLVVKQHKQIWRNRTGVKHESNSSVNNEWSWSRLVCRRLEADVGEKTATHGWRYLGQPHMGRDKSIQTEGSSLWSIAWPSPESCFVTVASPNGKKTGILGVIQRTCGSRLGLYLDSLCFFIKTLLRLHEGNHLKKL